MKPTAAIANSLWAASNVPAFMRFRRALGRPAETQFDILRRSLAQNRDCAYGRTHGFADIRSYEEFARRVSLVDYTDLEPWIERIKCGEQCVLTTDAVSHLIPTSGSMGERKLIPFTAGLQREFNRAIDPWLADLTRLHPDVLLGPAYWSITPATPKAEADGCAVPIGFADDASYLGGLKGWLARRTMVTPQSLSDLSDVEEFRYGTLRCLLQERELRLISVWHPSFLTLLLSALPRHWDALLSDIHNTDRERAAELERADPDRPATLWPHLRVISCWGDGAAATPMADLRHLFPKAFVQPKGLLATEAVVTIPFADAQPLAIRSHFFEFIDGQGAVHVADQLREYETYEVVVTTAGGLWRYRLRDCAQVTGFVGSTPSLRFIGRSGNVSDLCGEKLSEAFVTKVVDETLGIYRATPRFALFAPDQDAQGARYTFYVEGALTGGVADTLDQRLRNNPHYAYCRDLEQLLAVRLFAIREHGYETFARRLISEGMRLGDIKPTRFSRVPGWSKLFTGQYVEPSAVNADTTSPAALYTSADSV